MNEKHVRAVSAFEQAGAFLGVYAKFLSSYHKDLCASGFLRDEALSLVKEMQKMMFEDALKYTQGNDEED